MLGTPLTAPLLADDAVRIAFDSAAQFGHFLAFEIALTKAQIEAGQIDRAAGTRAITAMQGYTPDLSEIAKGTVQDGMPIPAFVRGLKAVAGDEAVHRFSTSQDVIDTALALTLKGLNSDFTARLDDIGARLSDLDAAFGTNPMSGRTRMQIALPITVGHRLSQWSDPLQTVRADLDRLKEVVEVLHLAGPVSDRRNLPQQVATHMATALGLGVGKTSHSNRLAMADYAGWLARLTGVLGKIGQDVCLMAQNEMDEIALRNSGGSSAMAHKQNPVAAEILVALARFNATQLAGMQQAMVHEQERSGAAWALEWMHLPLMLDACGSALARATDLLGDITRLGPMQRD